MDKSRNLQTNLLKWMESTGFPLEMAVANAFRQSGFDVRQSSTYVDPETGKGREIDVVVLEPDFIGAVDVGFAIECKSSDRPWLVLRSDDAFAGYHRFHAFALMTDSARKSLTSKAPNLRSMHYIERPSEGGYGLRQAFDGADNGYAATLGAVKACMHLARVKEDVSYKPCAIYFPVIVVDSPIFECTLQSDGQLALKEVDNSEFLFTAHMPQWIGCWVRIVAKKDLLRFATWARELAATLRADLDAEEGRILDSLGIGA